MAVGCEDAVATVTGALKRDVLVVNRHGSRPGAGPGRNRHDRAVSRRIDGSLHRRLRARRSGNGSGRRDTREAGEYQENRGHPCEHWHLSAAFQQTRCQASSGENSYIFVLFRAVTDAFDRVITSLSAILAARLRGWPTVVVRRPVIPIASRLVAAPLIALTRFADWWAQSERQRRLRNSWPR